MVWRVKAEHMAAVSSVPVSDHFGLRVQRPDLDVLGIRRAPYKAGLVWQADLEAAVGEDVRTRHACRVRLPWLSRDGLRGYCRAENDCQAITAARTYHWNLLCLLS